MEILLGFEMEKTGENLEYWTENFTQILDHILIRDTDNEIYWASPPPPPPTLLFTGIRNMSVLKSRWSKVVK